MHNETMATRAVPGLDEMLRDRLVVELHGDARLVDEAADVAAVVAEVCPQRLHDAEVVRAVVAAPAREEDLAHAAAAERVDEQVRPEGTREPGGERGTPRCSFSIRSVRRRRHGR